MPATAPWRPPCAPLSPCGWSLERTLSRAVSTSAVRSATTSAQGGLKYPKSQTTVASGRLVAASRAMAAGRPWSPAMIRSRAPNARRALGSRRGGQMSVSDAMRSGCACAKPVTSASMEAAKWARSISRWSSARRRRSAKSRSRRYPPALPRVLPGQAQRRGSQRIETS
jgi:hypothetical protein